MQWKTKIWHHTCDGQEQIFFHCVFCNYILSQDDEENCLLWILNEVISFDVSDPKRINLFGFIINLLLRGLFSQTSKGGQRLLLFYFNDITYLSPVCVSNHSSLSWWDRKLKWKSSVAGYQGKSFYQMGWLKCIWGAMSQPDSSWEASRVWSSVHCMRCCACKQYVCA